MRRAGVVPNCELWHVVKIAIVYYARQQPYFRVVTIDDQAKYGLIGGYTFKAPIIETMYIIRFDFDVNFHFSLFDVIELSILRLIYM